MSTKEILSLESGSGRVDMTPTFSDKEFGYTLYEGVADPANPEGPKGIGMRVEPEAMSKVWQLVEPGYSETVELLSGTATLAVKRGARKDEWVSIFLTPENPTGDDLKIVCGDAFCVVAGDEEAVLLSRPSREFDVSFEKALTNSSRSNLSRFVVDYVAPWARHKD